MAPTLQFWLNEIRAGYGLRNHQSFEIKRRNRRRVRYAVRKAREIQDREERVRKLLSGDNDVRS